MTAANVDKNSNKDILCMVAVFMEQVMSHTTFKKRISLCF